MASQFADVLQVMHREVWHFPVVDGAPYFADNGFAYFEEQAAEKAAISGYDLVALANTSIEGSRISGWVIRGNVLLKSPIRIPLPASALQAQMG